jgi:RimJ/RimL family protein N-acetyltransferase
VEPVRIETPRLLLRDFALSDAAATHAYERDPEVVRYQSHGPRTYEESLAYIERVLAESKEVPRRLFDLAVVRRDEGRLIGRVGTRLTSLEQREAILWYVLHRDAWGQGYMREAAAALVGYAFDTLNVHRVFVDADPRNTPSVRLAESLGMRREAHHIENLFLKGEWSDSLILAILDREHRSLRKQ